MRSLRKLKDPTKGRIRSEVWLRQAEHDLDVAQVSFENKYYEWATYQSEQAVEKSLKAVILHGGYIPPKIHKLAILMGYSNRINENFKHTKFDFRDLDSFTFISRYPFIIPGRNIAPHDQITKQDAKNLISQASDFLKKIRYILENDEPYDGYQSQAYEFDLEYVDIKARLEEVIDKIVEDFDTEKIILFGKYAREIVPKKATTIDLLVIANTKDNFLNRIKRVRELSRGSQPSIEPIVYNPEEFKYMTEEEGEGILEVAVLEGKVIYEKSKGKMLEKIDEKN